MGFTQADLAQHTGLSLRTIQRLESEAKAPKGHSLQVLSKAFHLDPSTLQADFLSERQIEEADKTSIKLINLSALAFIGIPFGNLILPFIVWRKKRKSPWVEQMGRRIINFQILWSIALCFLLCVAPFIDKSLSSSVPLVLIVLFTLMGINLAVIFTTAYKIHSGKQDFLNLPLSLF